MPKVTINGKEFNAKPLWDEWLRNTDFTSDKNPYLYEYFIDGAQVIKEDFEQQYQIACSKASS